MGFRIHIDKEKCKGCEYCLAVCKQAVLKLAKALNRTGRHYVEVDDADACEGCCKCGEICPDTAITIEKEED